jgi:SAM-dependent methyltransferase
MVDQLQIGPGSRVVDLAAGTGKFTRELLGRGATVIAIEPIEPMRASLSETSPGSLQVGGEAEELPLRSGSVDALTIAQAFHWIDTPATLAELGRVIKPDGGLGLIWNARLRSVGWLDDFWSIMDRAEKGASWRENASRSQEGRRLPGFTPFRSSEFFHGHVVTPELLVKRMASTSHIAALPSRKRQAVLDEARDLLATHPNTQGREALQITYRVDCFAARRERSDAR